MDDTKRESDFLKPSKLGSTSEQELARQAQAQWEHHQAYMSDPEREERMMAHRMEREARMDEILHSKSDWDWKSYFSIIAYGLGMYTLGYVLGMWHG